MGVAALLIQLTICVFMAGLIWTIQILHYPSFRDIRDESFIAFHARHSWRITWIVGPMMFLELLTAGILVGGAAGSVFFVLNFCAVLAIWGSTFFVSIPLHKYLAQRKDLEKIDLLVKTNWPRTLLWSLRAILLSVYFFEMLPAGLSLRN
jgi:hypothetical protein